MLLILRLKDQMFKHSQKIMPKKKVRLKHTIIFTMIVVDDHKNLLYPNILDALQNHPELRSQNNCNPNGGID